MKRLKIEDHRFLWMFAFHSNDDLAKHYIVVHCCSQIVFQSLAIIIRVDEIAFDLHRILIASNANKSSLSPLNGFAFNQAVIMEWVTGPKIAHIIIPHGKNSTICYVISSHALFSQRDFNALRSRFNHSKRSSFCRHVYDRSILSASIDKMYTGACEFLLFFIYYYVHFDVGITLIHHTHTYRQMF